MNFTSSFLLSSYLTSDFHCGFITFDTPFNDWIKTYQQKLSNDTLLFNTSSLSNDAIELHDLFREFMPKFSTENDSFHRRTQFVKNLFVIFFYSSIFIVSLIGNSLVCCVIFSNRKMLKLINNLIANLAFSDLLMTIINPLNIIRILVNNWPFSLLMCKLLPFIQVTSIYVSTFTMTIIAVNRYQALKSSKNRINIQSNQWHSLLIIISIWFPSMLLSSLFVMYNQVIEVIDNFQLTNQCQVINLEPNCRKLILSILFLAQFVIPLGITTIFYLLIGFKIWKRVSTTQEQISWPTKSKEKSIIIMVLVVIFFAVSWLPVNLYHILTDCSEQNFNSTAFLICFWFAMSSVCYNPFIYFGLSIQYRNLAKKMLKIPCLEGD